jgi:hypothetical protein
VSTATDTDVIHTTVRLPRSVRVALDAVRLGRAQRGARLPPSFNDLVIEALEELVLRDRRGVRRQGGSQ